MTDAPALDLAHLDAAGFDRLYKDKIEPCFAEYEPARVAAVDSFHKRLAFTAPIAVAAGVAIGTLAQDFVFGCVATLIATAMAYAFSYLKLQVVGTDAKIASLTVIAKAVGVSYSIEPPEAPALPRFRALDLVPGWDRSKFADFDLYEAHLETESEDSKGNKSYSTVFRGQLLRLRFPRKFLGVTIVRRDRGMFNMFGGQKNLKRVGLEDPHFEKIFEVYGSDQVEARYLVHPVLMERLIALEAALKGEKLRCAFEEGDLLIAVEGGDRFEIGDLFKPLADPERARKIVSDLGTVMQVMDAVLGAQARAKA